MRLTLLIIGSFLPLVSGLTYIVSIWRGNTLPQRMTRFLMLIITALMFGSLWADNDGSGVWLALVSFLQALCIWALTFKHGIGGKSRLDIVCLLLCGIGLGIWAITDEPWLGLVASIVADFIACVPSLVKTVRLPHTELMLFYALDAIAGVLIAAAGPFTARTITFPAYIVAINLAFVAVIAWPRNRVAVIRSASAK